MVPNRRNSNFRPCKSTQIQHFLGLSRLNPLMGLLGYSLFFSGNYPCQIMWVLRQCPQLGSRLFHQCSGDNLPQIFRGMSKNFEKGMSKRGVIKYKGGIRPLYSLWVYYKKQFKRTPKLCFVHYFRLVFILFNAALFGSAFSTYCSGRMVVHVSVFELRSLL